MLWHSWGVLVPMTPPRDRRPLACKHSVHVQTNRTQAPPLPGPQSTCPSPSQVSDNEGRSPGPGAKPHPARPVLPAPSCRIHRKVLARVFCSLAPPLTGSVPTPPTTHRAFCFQGPVSKNFLHDSHFCVHMSHHMWINRTPGTSKLCVWSVNNINTSNSNHKPSKNKKKITSESCTETLSRRVKQYRNTFDIFDLVSVMRKDMLLISFCTTKFCSSLLKFWEVAKEISVKTIQISHPCDQMLHRTQISINLIFLTLHPCWMSNEGPWLGAAILGTGSKYVCFKDKNSQVQKS